MQPSFQHHIDPLWSPLIAEKCSLACLCTPFELCYSVMDTQNRSILALGRYFLPASGNVAEHFAIAEIMQHDPILQLKFGSIVFAFQHPSQTLVPESWKEVSNLNSLHFQASDHSSVHEDVISGLGAYSRFLLPNKTLSFLKNRFPPVSIRHVSSLFLQQLLLMPQPIHCWVNRDVLLLAIKEGEKLRFFNAFAHHSASEAAYYILYTLQQFDTDFEQTQLRVSGPEMYNNELPELLKQYVAELHIPQRPQGYLLTAETEKPGVSTYELLHQLHL